MPRQRKVKGPLPGEFRQRVNHHVVEVRNWLLPWSKWRSWRRMLLAVCILSAGYLVFEYLTLPDVRPLILSNPTTTAFMERHRRLAEEKGEKPVVKYTWKSTHQISNNLKRAVLVAEDDAFFQHEGIDYKQLKESFWVNLKRHRYLRGASTITQQLAKNLYLSPTKSIVRKVREAFIAKRLERYLSKERILELYLNVAYWGRNCFGAEAAARTYFNKSAADLTTEEAALMAAMLQAPSQYDPKSPNRRLSQRKNMILSRLQHRRY